MIDILEKLSQSGKTTLTEFESKQVLKAYGVPVIEEILATSANEITQAVKQFGYPIVLKGHGKKLLHKTERGLVHLNLTTDESVQKAIRQIETGAGDDLEGFLVQPQISGRREFVAGLFHDIKFGPVVMFGLGGIFTEAISDVSFRLAPLTESDAAEMLDEIRSSKLLGAFRGEKEVDRNQLIQTLMGLSRIGIDYPDISEIDINPLIATSEGKLVAVDALVALCKSKRNTDSELSLQGKSEQDASFQCPGPDDLPSRIDPVLLGKFFHPRSIAFVGASPHFGKWGHNLMSMALSADYKGKIYLVNPSETMIAGHQVYKSVSDIPGKVDLAIVTIPASKVMDLIPQFKEKEIHNMLLISSGYGETGEEGRKLEKELVMKAREADIVIVGPNTMGILNPHIDLYCVGTHVRPKAGSTTVVSQSGNLGTQLLAFAEQQGIGVRVFSGSGNEAMVTIEDYLEGSEVDQLTQIIVLYVESVKNGRRFFEISRRIGKKKPIVLLNGGRSNAGKRAASTHTGALTTDRRIFDAVCKQAGIIRAEYPMDLLDMSAAFSALPIPKGKRTAIMTLGGGWGVVTTDLCSEYGLEVPDLSPDIVSRINKILPPYWSKTNPVDIVGEIDNKIPVVVLEELIKWDGCDAVINLGIIGRKYLLGRYGDSVLKSDPTFSPDFLHALKKKQAEFEEKYIERIVRLMEKYDKPVIGVGILLTDKDQTVYQIPNSKLGGLIFPTPERAVKTLSKMCEYRRFLDR